MGLKGDLQEITSAWGKASWRLKAFFIFSIFLASNSVATLSDTIFRWKGFVKDAVSFYQEYVAGPLVSLAKLALPDLHIPPGMPHLFILSALYLGANIRVAAFSLPASRSKRLASRATSSYLGAMIAIFIGMHFSGEVLNENSPLGLFAGSAACASFEYFRQGGAARILWFANLLAPFVVVGRLGAANAGLNRIL
jgi:hypothetical protein